MSARGGEYGGGSAGGRGRQTQHEAAAHQHYARAGLGRNVSNEKLVGGGGGGERRNPAPMPTILRKSEWYY